MKSSDKRATAELLAALVEVAIAHGRRHYSQSGEPLATTLAVLECLWWWQFGSVPAHLPTCHQLLSDVRPGIPAYAVFSCNTGLADLGEDDVAKIRPCG
jgi:hypothetical protein